MAASDPPSMSCDFSRDLADAPHISIALFGMSGVGKTHLARLLRAGGDWYHYSVDFRIGTRYMGEHIVDNLKREAIRSSPFLRAQLIRGAAKIDLVLDFENLAALSSYLGKPGDPERGGLAFEEYVLRQRQHREAEILSMLDAPLFIEKARSIYRCPHFLCDTSGSFVEIVDPTDPRDPVLTELSRHMRFVYIRESPSDREELLRRFQSDPKPMYYDEAFLREIWGAYLAETGSAPDRVDPDHFAAWGFERLLARRAPKYAAIAERWGVTIDKDEAARAQTAEELLELIARAEAEAGAGAGALAAGR